MNFIFKISWPHFLGFLLPLPVSCPPASTRGMVSTSAGALYLKECVYESFERLYLIITALSRPKFVEHSLIR